MVIAIKEPGVVDTWNTCTESGEEFGGSKMRRGDQKAIRSDYRLAISAYETIRRATRRKAGNEPSICSSFNREGTVVVSEPPSARMMRIMMSYKDGISPDGIDNPEIKKLHP